VRAVRHLALEEALLEGLAASEHDATLLRVLPIVLARHGHQLDWSALTEGARRRKLNAPLGMLIELTASLAGHSEWVERLEDLKDRRVKRMRFFPAVKSSFEAELARQRSPEVARRWGLWMNVSEQSFRSTLELHPA
jgi:hypothetical protein